ncbi:MAG: SUMF1/EgtB/PvdO family nonheme iron enzyme, partial [Phycisphaerales bacterium]|nr:SUMF1/EgtB/PvdO family nonheme iron enzyme [Phycisphaerales bacterium]
EDVPPMQRIELADGTSFEMDTFEAALENGKAVSGKHLIPGTRMSWFAAKDACEAAGKRMCTEREWIAACQGEVPVDDDADGELADDLIEGTSYPYGDYHDPRRCWDARNHDTERPVYTGEMPGCVSKHGVYDLTGNMEEWVGTTPENAVLLGGAYDTDKDHARCYRRNTTFGAGYASLRTGFRCCR